MASGVGRIDATEKDGPGSAASITSDGAETKQRPAFQILAHQPWEAGQWSENCSRRTIEASGADQSKPRLETGSVQGSGGSIGSIIPSAVLYIWQVVLSAGRDSLTRIESRFTVRLRPVAQEGALQASSLSESGSPPVSRDQSRCEFVFGVARTLTDDELGHVHGAAPDFGWRRRDGQWSRLAVRLR